MKKERNRESEKQTFSLVTEREDAKRKKTREREKREEDRNRLEIYRE